ncbi:hypothetical protein LCGC14_0785810 [marine sediment metagenome]|uniref:HNH domain-containing protein n=1 Tax=marine sediment metagenome TaxID=412755 RepID=A0A0F9PYC2_9ZZZZ
MPSNYWLKLYHEILHDAEFAKLDDRLWRRVIEFSLFASREGSDKNILPSLQAMAWELRISEEDLAGEINALVRLHYLDVYDDGELYVTDWQKKPQVLTESRASAAYHCWRGNVIQRDEGFCQACGATQGEFHAHHILPWAGFPESRYDVANGITLCAQCHKDVHREMREHAEMA